MPFSPMMAMRSLASAVKVKFLMIGVGRIVAEGEVLDLDGLAVQLSFSS